MATKLPTVSLQLDDSALKRLTPGLRRKAERGVRRTGLLIKAAAVRIAPFRTKNLVNSAVTEFSGEGFDSRAEIKFTAPYALFVHTGTGVFGPKGKPIVIEAVNAKALFWPGAKHPVKRVVIKGQKAQPFLKEAFEEEGPKLEERIFN